MKDSFSKKGTEAYLEKERSFSKGLENLKSAPVDMVDDFQAPAVKDLTVDKITNPVQKVKSGGDFVAEQIIRESRKAAAQQVGDTLNYNELKKQFVEKAKKAARSGAGKKLLGAVPVLGGLASAAMSGDASAAVPFLDSAESLGPELGSFEDRLERGLLTEQDKQQLAMEQARIQALQQIK